jgi:hypothetical protein
VCEIHFGELAPRRRELASLRGLGERVFRSASMQLGTKLGTGIKLSICGGFKAA